MSTADRIADTGGLVTNAEWVDRALTVEGRPVTVSVRVLSVIERESVAGFIAWLTAACRDADAPDATAWRLLIQEIGQHLSFAVDESIREELDSAWWGQAVAAAATALIQVNGLGELVRRMSAWDFAPDKVNRVAS